MTVSLSDIMKLERKLRLLDKAMNPKLLVMRGIHNSPHEQPIQVTYGSNSFHVDRNDLGPLLDDEDPTVRWLTGTFADFLDRHAGDK